MILLGIIGPWQVLLIIAVILLIFGGKKLPELMKGFGEGIKEFKKSVKDDDSKPSDSAPKETDNK